MTAMRIRMAQTPRLVAVVQEVVQGVADAQVSTIRHKDARLVSL